MKIREAVSFPSRAISMRNVVALAVFVAAVAGCAVGPTYERPSVPTPAAFKEAHNWQPAAPADAAERGDWWNMFRDPVLDNLIASVEVSNQNVAAAAATYAQARALVREQRSGLFPSVTLNGGTNRSGGGGTGTSARSINTGSSGTNYQASIGASWEPDVWGRLSRGVESATASAQASAADLASAKLSAQGELAADYFSLRLADAQMAMLRATIVGYQRSLQIAQNRYAAGIGLKTDVLQAQTQLVSAQAEEVGLQRQRAQMEHAIAVLIGKPPSEFALPVEPWNVTVPDIPAGVPSLLLQRRPDIAAAERRVAAANEQIGIEQAGYFPSLTLNASNSSAASRVADLFAASTSFWSLGLSAAETLFNAGLTGARVSAAKAAHEQAVARYRQTVLTAFQDVEDQLAASRVLAQQTELQRQASQAADEAELRTLNRYKAGQVIYTEVVTAQATALNARRALVQLQAQRQAAAVALIQALGGGWQAEQ